MFEEDVNRCQIQEWYPKFRSISIKTVIIELPEHFIHYLLDDSGPFVLPLSLSNQDALPNRIQNPEEEEDFVVLEGAEDESEETPIPQSFPEIESQIENLIESFGGSIFPKLNWSAPKDSAWISSTGTLKCSSFSEIALLFKSFDSLVHNLCQAYNSCTDRTMERPSTFFLALRKWYPSLLPEIEFRCFGRARDLIRISQREATSFYPSLLEAKDEIETVAGDFFIDEVREKFESNSYTFDVYATNDGRVKLLDFNPWGEVTLPLLFFWEELEEKIGENGNKVEFRIVDNQCGVRPGLKTAVPYDYLDTSSGSGWDQFLRNADVAVKRQTQSCDDGDGRL